MSICWLSLFLAMSDPPVSQTLEPNLDVNLEESIPAPVERVLSLVFTGDTFGFWGRAGMAGGAPKIKAFLDTVRRAHPTVLLDSGNIIAPFYYSRPDEGDFAARMIQRLNYDGVNLGFHDLAYGASRTEELARMHGVPWISTEVR